MWYRPQFVPVRPLPENTNEFNARIPAYNEMVQKAMAELECDYKSAMFAFKERCAYALDVLSGFSEPAWVDDVGLGYGQSDVAVREANDEDYPILTWSNVTAGEGKDYSMMFGIWTEPTND